MWPPDSEHSNARLRRFQMDDHGATSMTLQATETFLVSTKIQDVMGPP